MSVDGGDAGGRAEAARGEEELRRALALYEARLSEFAELAARVRHEINNPLTGLIGQTQLLLRDELSETARRRVNTIEQLATRIRDTVAELRSVRLPDAGDPACGPPKKE
jgi:two-component system, NtrC family, sensor kinase